MRKFSLAVLVISSALLLLSAWSLNQDSAPASGVGSDVLPSTLKKGAKVSVITLAEPCATAYQRTQFFENVKLRPSGGSRVLFRDDDRVLVGVEVLDVQGSWAYLAWADIDPDSKHGVDLKRQKRAWINSTQIVSVWNE